MIGALPLPLPDVPSARADRSSIAFEDVKAANISWERPGSDWYESFADGPAADVAGNAAPGSASSSWKAARSGPHRRRVRRSFELVPKHDFGAESIHRAWLDTSGLPEHRTEEHRPLVERSVAATGKLPD